MTAAGKMRRRKLIEQVMRPSSPRSPMRLAAIIAVLMVAATGVLAYRNRTPSTSGDENLRKLARIVGTHRLTRARLSGGFAYARCQLDSSGNRLVRGFVCRSDKPSSWRSAGRLSDFAADMRGQNPSTGPDAHASGVFELVWGNVDEAVVDLREAARRTGRNASVFNDLAVALTEKAERGDDPSTLIDAFVAADSAVRLDGTLPEAQFTLAVLLERLYLQRDAIEAWHRYLRLDSTSAWADEARQRVTAIQPRADQWKDQRERLLRAVASSDTQTIRAIVAENPVAIRTLVQRQLGAWGAALDSGDTASSRAQLDAARALAEPLRQATGDALMRDAVAAIDQSLARKDAVRLRELAKGHAALMMALDHFRPGNSAVRNELASARTWLANGASPMKAWASLYEARAQLQTTLQAPHNPALQWLTAIRDSAPKQYLALRSSAAQYRGYIYDVRSDYTHAVASYDSALAESRTTQDPQVTLRVGVWLSQAESVLRGKQAGWRTRYAALAATPGLSASEPALYSAFDYAGLATAHDAPRLSLRYCDESIRIALERSDPSTRSYAFRRRAELFATLGQLERARADIASSLAAAQQVMDTAGRPMLIADVMLAGAKITLRSAPAAAEPILRDVIQEYQHKNYNKGLSSAYLALAQSQAATGQIESARKSFDSATTLMQRQRATVKEYTERGAFLDAAREVIDQIAAFHADHNERDAFEYFEGTRSRVLLEELADSRGQSAARPQPALDALQRHLTNDDLVLSYAVLPNELLIWLIGRDRFEQHRVQIPAPELEDLVEQFRRSLLGGSIEPDIGISGRLYQVLIDSAGRIGSANLIVIPDRWLHFLPFAALREPTTGHYLVRDHAVTYAPSATLLAANLARPRRVFSASSRILAIGNPAFDRQAFQLPYLPAAEREARRIAALYAGQTLLTGRDATDAALERLAPSFDILHFAGHAIVGRDAPQLSELVLASDGHSEGAVFSSQIAHWKLTRTRLAILSGCSTADGKLSATEGASSLARAFMEAGVPQVVSSLWAIDDDDTADFFVAFHRRLAEGHPAEVALRETQIKWLGEGPTAARPVRSWAAFQLFGG